MMLIFAFIIGVFIGAFIGEALYWIRNRMNEDMLFDKVMGVLGKWNIKEELGYRYKLARAIVVKILDKEDND